MGGERDERVADVLGEVVEYAGSSGGPSEEACAAAYEDWFSESWKEADSMTRKEWAETIAVAYAVDGPLREAPSVSTSESDRGAGGSDD